MIQITLNDGLRTMVDREDALAVLRGSWYAVRRKNALYVCGRPDRRGEPVYLHRHIMKAGPDDEIDHIDGNGLNNQRSNLRRLLHHENLWNSSRSRLGCASRFRGVSWSASEGRWRVTIDHIGKKLNVGFYDNEETAARAYDLVATALRGKLAKLNFPDDATSFSAMQLPEKMRLRLRTIAG